jgi:hypothetical protein
MGMDKGLLAALTDHQEKARGPHFIFSAENPKHADKNQLNMSHHQVIHHLGSAGYDSHEINGLKGAPKSIIVYGINENQANDLHKLASRLGQDSSIYSDGNAHEQRFHHGLDEGKSLYGKGTVWHKQPPEGNYTSLPGGAAYFTHHLGVDKQLSGQLHVRK